MSASAATSFSPAFADSSCCRKRVSHSFSVSVMALSLKSIRLRKRPALRSSAPHPANAQTMRDVRRSVHSYVGRVDDFAPFHHLRTEERIELLRRTRDDLVAVARKPLAYVSRIEALRDLLMEACDDLPRRTRRHGNACPRARLEA